LGYLGGSAEIDLVVNRDAPERLVNVAYSLLEDSTWSRELRALDAGATRFPDAEREVVVHERARRSPPAGARIIDAWRYLLELSHENHEHRRESTARRKK
jgi:predicted AAA+ superfamily ATPase